MKRKRSTVNLDNIEEETIEEENKSPFNKSSSYYSINDLVELKSINSSSGAQSLVVWDTTYPDFAILSNHVYPLNYCTLGDGSGNRTGRCITIKSIHLKLRVFTYEEDAASLLTYVPPIYKFILLLHNYNETYAGNDYDLSDVFAIRSDIPGPLLFRNLSETARFKILWQDTWNAIHDSEHISPTGAETTLVGSNYITTYIHSWVSHKLYDINIKVKDLIVNYNDLAYPGMPQDNVITLMVSTTTDSANYLTYQYNCRIRYVDSK